VGVNAVHRSRKKSLRLEAQLHELARDGTPIAIDLGMFEPNRVKLRRAGVRFTEVDELRCDAPEELVGTQLRFCRGGAATADGRRGEGP
jgi:hypothetical protein